MITKIDITRFPTPCGELTIGSAGESICLCDWSASPHHAAVLSRLRRHLDANFREATSDCCRKAISQLEEYLSGQRTAFDLHLLHAGTPLQRAVWEAISGIPYSRTATYSEIASRVGLPKGVRAVANATGANAMSILIPCHRIIGRDGSLTGYAGGLAAKRFLLELEQAASIH